VFIEHLLPFIVGIRTTVDPADNSTIFPFADESFLPKNVDLIESCCNMRKASALVATTETGRKLWSNIPYTILVLGRFL
jgi:hypothetical protein